MLAITAPGPSELLIIGLIFVLLFGAKKLPELGGAIGRSLNSFKRGVAEDDGDEAIPSADVDVRSEDAALSTSR